MYYSSALKSHLAGVEGDLSYARHQDPESYVKDLKWLHQELVAIMATVVVDLGLYYCNVFANRRR